MTRQQRQARHVVAALAIARHLQRHDEPLRGRDDRRAAEYTASLLAAHSRSIRVGLAYSDRYGAVTTEEIKRHAAIHL